MIKNKKLLGATLVTAAALAFSSIPVTSSLAAADNKTGVKCFGINSCKGTGACKTSVNSCKGQNGCKHQGVVMKKSAKACKKAGGQTTEKK